MDSQSEVGSPTNQILHKTLLLSPGSPTSGATSLNDKLLLAVETDDVDLAMNLLTEGASRRSKRADTGEGLLHVACRAGQLRQLIMLLRVKGMNCDMLDAKENLPLHTAAFYGRERAVKALIRAGALLWKENLAGEFPGDAFSPLVGQDSRDEIRKMLHDTLAKFHHHINVEFKKLEDEIKTMKNQALEKDIVVKDLEEEVAVLRQRLKDGKSDRKSQSPERERDRAKRKEAADKNESAETCKPSASTTVEPPSPPSFLDRLLSGSILPESASATTPPKPPS